MTNMFSLHFTKTCKRYSTAIANIVSNIKQELIEIQKSGSYKHERILLGRQGIKVHVAGTKQPVINFCANNYLGLSSHEDIIEAGKNALHTYGAGLSSVRFICGTQDIHKQLENALALFHEKEDAILYASCFDANAGIFEALLDSNDAVISDELNHASLIDGIRLTKAKRFRYKHMNMIDLESKLQEAKEYRRKMIVTDGVFSMDGDVAPLPEIVNLANKYDAVVLVDECHATGFFGKTGRGTEEYFGNRIKGSVHLINSTLGKAMGGAMGGYTTGPKPIIDLLRQKSRPYLFSNSLAPAVVGSSLKAVQLLMKDSKHAESLLRKTTIFRTRMKNLGFKVAGNSEHPICPVMLDNARLTTEFANRLLEFGIYAIGFSYPVVPKDKPRIRIQISAAHSEEDIEKCIEAFSKVQKLLNI
ncbi:2-amino-3-ketobutyrate coenzyme A ligase, mitochondrial [Trichinella pseudospiralis]|uniref:2-amino-3-ketobutyrate coenzyme A ligase, mitochondrial n=1 Tax=Trichinella pseudospiralis TaxID=6337 RepID=A0A0V1FWC1_TRIPS|nr:2-amino-3-ketobutyrate coenzyme A ligase, mitochondrial [Trichinella pseudospiralis]